jgi:hypothetical protein
MRSVRLATGLPALLLCLLVVAALPPAGAQAQGGPPPLPGFCIESDRFGVWHTRGRIDSYAVEQLHAGWYTSWAIMEKPLRPGGIRPVQLVRLSDDGPFADRACTACPTWDKVRTTAQLNPGSLWFIGNEPDRQDYVDAERYAQLYHDFYTFLKAEDPGCQVAIGGVVQPTPIRLQYLDLILDAYQDQYGGPMPVDVWNVHNYVLREGEGWGCGIPPDTDPALAIEYEIEDHDRLDYWIGQLVAMRQWMRDRGYRDRPLVLSEFGILMPTFYGYDYERVRAFMLATFDWLMTATDPETGYPADDDRLVQAWAWFSLSESTFETWPVRSHLFDPGTYAITALGRDFGAYTAPLTEPFSGTVDLKPVALRHTRPQTGAGGSVTTTLAAEIHNAGSVGAQDIVVRFERDGLPAGEVSLPAIAPGATVGASLVWTGLQLRQPYAVRVEVDPGGQIAECNAFNNSLSIRLVLGDHWIYLPLVRRDG